MKTKLTLALLLISLTARLEAKANEKNLLIGSWKWTSDDCKNGGDFVFTQDKIIHHTSADGEKVDFTFDKVKYVDINSDSVLVDFGSETGLNGKGKTTEMKYLFIDKDHIKMDRKKGFNDLIRCPTVPS